MGDEEPCCSSSLTPTSINNSERQEVGPTMNIESAQPHTVLRLKRRIDEDPAQALLLSFKRCKGDDGWREERSEKGDVIQHVLKLAVTLTPDQSATSVAESISQVLASPDSAVDRLSLKNRKIKLLDKSRSKFQETIVENRFRLISSRRGLDNPLDSKLSGENNESEDLGDMSISKAVQDMYKLYDLEDIADGEPVDVEFKHASESRPVGSITCNGLPMLSEPKKRTSEENERDTSESKKAREETQVLDPGYVYDLYITNEAIDNYVETQRVCVNIYSDEFLTTQLYQGEGSGSEDEKSGGFQDEEDSNDEDNWRNDYPSDDPDADEDEDEADSDAEEMDVEGELSHLRTRFNQMKFKELSSDDEDEGNGLFGSSRYYMKREKAEDEVVSSASDSD